MAKNHHYIPQCYQRGFTEADPPPCPKPEPMIWQAELKTSRVRLRPTRKVGCAAGFYALGSSTEEINEAAEREHGRLESVVAPTLRKLNALNFDLRSDEWEVLLTFAAALSVRGPLTKNILDGMRQTGNRILHDYLGNMPPDQFLRLLEETNPGETFSAERVREMQKWVRSNPEFQMPVPPRKWIETSLKTALGTVLPLYRKMSWTFLHAPPSHVFVCSDYPVSQIDPTVPRGSRRGHGLESRHIEVCLPLGRSLALMGHWEPAPIYLPVSGELVDQINLRSIEHARIEILGPTRASVEWGLRLLRPRRALPRAATVDSEG